MYRSTGLKNHSSVSSYRHPIGILIFKDYSQEIKKTQWAKQSNRTHCLCNPNFSLVIFTCMNRQYQYELYVFVSSSSLWLDILKMENQYWILCFFFLLKIASTSPVTSLKTAILGHSHVKSVFSCKYMCVNMYTHRSLLFATEVSVSHLQPPRHFVPHYFSMCFPSIRGLYAETQHSGPGPTPRKFYSCVVILFDAS